MYFKRKPTNRTFKKGGWGEELMITNRLSATSPASKLEPKNERAVLGTKSALSTSRVGNA